jgi:hypothetical protein
MTTAVRYTLDTLLIMVPLTVMTFFLFDPAAFNLFPGWLPRSLILSGNRRVMRSPRSLA